MKSRIGQGILYLPTGNRTGSVKCLNVSTGSIVTRDTIRIVPTTTAIIKVMNDLAALDGRYMSKLPAAVHDLIYNQSVSKHNMPTFLPLQPAIKDMGALALIPDNPTHAEPLVLADTLDPVPALTDDDVQHVEGGVRVVKAVSPELPDNEFTLDPLDQIQLEDTPVHEDTRNNEDRHVTEDHIVETDTGHADRSVSQEESPVSLSRPPPHPSSLPVPLPHRYRTRWQQNNRNIEGAAHIRGDTGKGQTIKLSSRVHHCISREAK